MSGQPGARDPRPDADPQWAPTPRASAPAPEPPAASARRRRRDDDIDALFGAGGAAAQPRVGLVLALLAAGMVLAVLGALCTPAVGAVFVLLGLYVAEKDSARVESGYLPLSERGRVRRVRGLAVASVLLVVVLFVTQTALIPLGLYDGLWLGAVERLAELRESVYPLPDPPPDPGAPAPPGAPPAPAPPAPAPPPGSPALDGPLGPGHP